MTTSHPYPDFPPSNNNNKNNKNNPSEEHVLIRTAYAALNPADLVTLHAMPWFLHSTQTAVPCLDLTGTVVAVHNPSRFSPNQRIMAFCPIFHLLSTGSGGLQSVISLPARYCVPLPESQSLLSGAGLFLTGLTAQVQVRDAKIKLGDRVLVVGASGGCGSMAVQLARNIVGRSEAGAATTAAVVAVCSGRNAETVKELGADEVVDYTLYQDLPGELKRRYGGDSDDDDDGNDNNNNNNNNNSNDNDSSSTRKVGKKFDAVIDCYGDQAVYVNSRDYLKPLGVYSAVSIHYEAYTRWELLKSLWVIVKNLAWPRATWLFGTGRTFTLASMSDPGLAEMEELNALFAEGKLKVALDSVWEFDQVHEALDKLSSGHAAGKVVIRVDPDEE